MESCRTLLSFIHIKIRFMFINLCSQHLHILQLTIFRNLIWDFHVVSNNPSQTLIIKVYVVLFLFSYELTVSKANSILNQYQTGHLSTPYGHQNYWQQNIQSCLFITFSTAIDYELYDHKLRSIQWIAFNITRSFLMPRLRCCPDLNNKS